MVKPSLALVNAGYRNRFGHPREDVLARYDERSVPWLRTDWHGAVLIESTPGRRDAVRWRDRRQRYWVEHPDRDERRNID